MTHGQLFAICPDCHGRGMVFDSALNDDRVCLSCRQLLVVPLPVGMPQTLSQLETLTWRVKHHEEILHKLAQGCQRLQREYGLPYARTCERCGFGGKCEVQE